MVCYFCPIAITGIDGFYTYALNCTIVYFNARSLELRVLKFFSDYFLRVGGTLKGRDSGPMVLHNELSEIDFTSTL